ncbi:MAG: MBL fold metallo-hydrolase [Anaerolineae bacterium]|nr:MBL fold metallo-hydrolase [Anaerolineae bacterium]
MQEIAEGVVVSTEFRRITVGAVATGYGIVCIDVPPFPDDAHRWRSQLLEYFKQPIRLLVLTDAQRDRLLGLHWFDEARIVAHDATMDAMKALPHNYVDLSADLLAENSYERIAFGDVQLRYPSVTFSTRMSVFIEDVEIPLTAVPGPTPGNVWLHLPEKRVVFTGDSVVVGMPPYMTRAQSKAWLESLTLLRRPRFAADVIVPGRGPLASKEDTRLISDLVRYMRRRVQNLHRAGRARVEVVELLPDVLEHVDAPQADQQALQWRFRMALESIYDEFCAEAEEAEDRANAEASDED